MSNLLLLADIASLSSTTKFVDAGVQTEESLNVASSASIDSFDNNNHDDLPTYHHQHNNAYLDVFDAPTGHDYIKEKDFDILVNANHDYYNRVTQTDEDQEHSYAFCVANRINDDTDCSAPVNNYSTDDPFLEGIANLDEHMGIQNENSRLSLPSTFEEAVQEDAFSRQKQSSSRASSYVVFDGIELDDTSFSDLAKYLEQQHHMHFEFDDLLRYVIDDRCCTPQGVNGQVVVDCEKSRDAKSADLETSDCHQAEEQQQIVLKENSNFVCSWNSCNENFPSSDQLIRHLLHVHLSGLNSNLVDNTSTRQNAKNSDSGNENITETVDVGMQTERSDDNFHVSTNPSHSFIQEKTLNGFVNTFHNYYHQCSDKGDTRDSSAILEQTDRANGLNRTTAESSAFGQETNLCKTNYSMKDLHTTNTSAVSCLTTHPKKSLEIVAEENNVLFESVFAEGDDESSSVGNVSCAWQACTKLFKNILQLVMHLRETHLQCKQTVWTCKWDGCTKKSGFKHRYLLERHLRIHTTEKPFLCNFCGKKLSTKNRLDCHERIHTGERPYQCTICDKQFTTSGDYCRHKNVHENVLKFECTSCCKRFKCDSGLRKHKKTCADNINGKQRLRKKKKKPKIIEKREKTVLKKLNRIAMKARRNIAHENVLKFESFRFQPADDCDDLPGLIPVCSKNVCDKRNSVNWSSSSTDENFKLLISGRQNGSRSYV